MNLQKLIFCNQIECILVEKKVCLSEYDSFLIKAFENLQYHLLVADSQPITKDFVSKYKRDFSKAFQQFYIVYKKIMQQWDSIAFDINTITFQDIPSINRVLETFNATYHAMFMKVEPTTHCV